MKKFKEVEKNRIQYHNKGSENSVHRSSLLVPEIEGTKTEISFVNHFLLKRSYDNVACRITGIDANGKKITSYLHKISEPRVYVFDLTGAFAGVAKSYIVDFFAPENLYIPFPAVMINHYGNGFLNTVHSYNRVLNDVFEDDSINEVQVSESSIDVQVDENTDTFIMFNAGQTDCSGTVTFELASANENKIIEQNVDVKRFTAKRFNVSELFGVTDIRNNAVLKVKQPTQHMFYGRMLAGQIKKSDNSFSANHSYYDSSTTEEYWDNDTPSSRVYPFFKQLQNSIRMHAIMSPGELDVFIVLYNTDGKKLAESSAKRLKSPSSDVLEINANNVAADNGISFDDITSFEVVAKPVGGKTPTRINHQLVYQQDDKLFSSVNISLVNPNVFTPAHKTGVAWGQIIADNEIDSYLGFVLSSSSGEAAELVVEYYDENGKLGQSEHTIIPGAAIVLNTKDDIEQIAYDKDTYGRNLWYVIKSTRPDILALVVSQNNATGHCTGEHSF